MAIQIRGNQVQDATLLPAKLDLTALYDFSSGTLQAATPSNNADVATKAYVDSQISGDAYTGLGAIDVTGHDISLLYDGAYFDLDVSNNLFIKANAIDTGNIADLAVTDAKLAGSISNGKLANSTISGISLGSSLFALSAAGPLSMTSYDGSAAVSDLSLDYDAAMFGVDGSSQLIIADGAISNAKLQDGSISSAKLQNDAVTSFKLATDSVVTLKIQDGAVTNAKLADLSVATGKLQDASVTGAKIALNAVATGNIQGGAVTQAKLANDSVGSSQIINGSVAAAELASDAVETAKIKDGAVTTAKIANAAVDASKLATASVGMAALNIQSYWSSMTPDSSATTFDLAKPLDSKFSQLMVFRNGIAQMQVASAPGADEYSVSGNGGTGGVGRITFGSAPASGENVRAFYIAAV